ncbi:TraX family protein [Paenibacillus sp. GXUN7292]|uniref:TraX family protein n=1 Tax=Paenibacillus sp. GXUN7292 TaxID=3422499 RepID=UPI003D7EEA17
MQLIAMLTMLIDHIGFVFLPDQLHWRLIGRLAFPVYAYCIVLGYHYTKDSGHYLLRLAVLAIISQLPYTLGLGFSGLNVIADLSVCLAVLILLDRFPHKYIRVLVVLAALILLELLPFGYGGYALLLVLIYRYSKGIWAINYHIALNLLFILTHDDFIQFASVASTVLIFYAKPFLNTLGKVRFPRWFWRSFYPAHMVAIGFFNTILP